MNFEESDANLDPIYALDYQLSIYVAYIYILNLNMLRDEE